MTDHVVGPALDLRLYPTAAILPLVQAAAAADPRLEIRETDTGLQFILTAHVRAEGEQCLSKLLTRLTEAAMEALLLTQPLQPGVPPSIP